MTEGEEVVALINSYYDQGKIPQDDPQLASKLAAIKAKYAQQQPTQQQTTTQDTGALANVGTDDGQQDTGQKVYLTSNQGNTIPGQRSSRFVYMVDQDTGQQYVYDDNEGKWLEVNKKYADIWPNISEKKDPPADHEQFKDVSNKYEKYFKENLE